MIKKILIANRGEVAARIIKACREMGIASAAIYSEADKHALHLRLADEAYLIGPPPSSESYLHIGKIIDLAKRINADAIHPGYGFLSENDEFIKAVECAGLIFIGPSSHSVKLMGGKTSARKLMQQHGVPIVPGTTKPISNIDEAKAEAAHIGFPILLKASAGGGGKGMRKVFSEKDFEESFLRAQNEASKAFGAPDVYMEKLIEDPKHIEVQIIADTFGSYVSLFERECSIQRRHQKVIEEAPSSFVDEELRGRLSEAAIKAAKACNYYNAGTIEFLVDKYKNFYFLEMNTRLQVEHPVTELITGIDIVKEQINIAAGKKLSFTQDEVRINGAAIECRIYAEDADNNFAPSTGKITHHRLPNGVGIRVDKGVDLHSNISVYYDPLLTKLSAWGRTREEALGRMKRALSEYKIAGVITNIPFCRWILNRPEFVEGDFDINFIDKYFSPLVPGKWKTEDTSNYMDVAAILGALLKSQTNGRSSSKTSIRSLNMWRDKA